MGAFFGITSKTECIDEVFFGTDYHSHLGTHRGGFAAWDKEIGHQREIHSIEDAPFRTKFRKVACEMHGTTAMGCISDGDPQPLLIRTKFGTWAVCMVGIINNKEELIDKYLQESGAHFDAMTAGKVNGVELFAALVAQKPTVEEGIAYAQDAIDGTASVLIITSLGNFYAARDKYGRLPVQIGKREDGHAISFESFAYEKFGYETVKELGPGEIVKITPDEIIEMRKARDQKRVCAFLWSYYGYPTSAYEGVNVEAMRYRNGAIMARNDCVKDIDYVGGVPDSGTPHAIGYANESKFPFARALVKYTPTWARSFMPKFQAERMKVAKMKQLPVADFIKDKKLLFVDDSIVRGTQLGETTDFLYENGAKEVHIRSACPPIMYGCKYLNFSPATNDKDLITRRTILELEGEEGLKYIDEYSDATTERGKAMLEAICDKMGLASLKFQSLDGVIEAIGLKPCDLCTYCWNGKE